MKHTHRIITLLFLISLGVNSCNTSKKKDIEETKINSIFKTSYFNDYFQLYKDSSFAEFVINRHFTLIGEEGFLDSKFYDSYIIFTITENWKPLKVFVIKSRKGIANISYKEILGERSPYGDDDKSIIMKAYKINSKSKIVNDSFEIPFKQFIKNMKVKKPNILDFNYREIYRELFYLDSSSYSYIIEDYFSNDALIVFDSMLTNQKEFKELMDLDSVIDFNTIK